MFCFIFSSCELSISYSALKYELEMNDLKFVIKIMLYNML